MRLAARTDDNHAAVRSALRSARCKVQDLSRVGDGCPDLLVWTPYLRRLKLLEVKDENKPPCEQKLTPRQEKWHREWPGEDHHVVNSPEAALRVCGVPG